MLKCYRSSQGHEQGPLPSLKAYQGLQNHPADWKARTPKAFWPFQKQTRGMSISCLCLRNGCYLCLA